MTKNKWRMCCSLNIGKSLDRILYIENYCYNSTQAISVENYEIRFFRSDYMRILEYLCRVYFLTTLDIYKDYFKSCHKIMQSDNTCILWLETRIALVHHILCTSYRIFTSRVLWPRSFLIFMLMNCRTLQPTFFFKLVC